jgi:protein RecA
MRLVNKRWPGAMQWASDPELEIRRLPTGIFELDVMLDGGFARGRYTELFGSANVGKTAVTYRSMARTQEDGGNAAFVDAEGSFDPEFAESLGVDLERLAFHRQDTAEGVVDFVEVLLRSRLYDEVVVDSIATLLPKSERDSSMGDASMGMEQAKLMSKALRKLTAANRDTALIFINQTRQAVGASAFAKQTTTSGGRAMGFYAGTRLELVRTENVKKIKRTINTSSGKEEKSSRAYGHRVLLRVDKEKTGATHTGDETTLVYDYDLGDFDPVEGLIYLGRVHDVLHISGAGAGQKWWVDGYEDEKKSSRPALKKWLRSDELVQEELREMILERAAAARADPIDSTEDPTPDDGDDDGDD